MKQDVTARKHEYRTALYTYFFNEKRIMNSIWAMARNTQNQLA